MKSTNEKISLPGYVHPPLKLFSTDLKKIRHTNQCFFFENIRIFRIEVAGEVLKSNSFGFSVLDFFDRIFIHSKNKPEKHAYRITCGLYYNNGIQFRCIELKKINFYEEIFFWKEVVEYKKIISREAK